jgi:hypothetical protein
LGLLESCLCPVLPEERNAVAGRLRAPGLNAAIVAAVTCVLAEMDVSWDRHTRAQIRNLVDETDLGKDMRTFGLMSRWGDGSRGHGQ